MVGLLINPVSGLIAQQPGPIKMRQVTRCHWSYIRNYNRIHYVDTEQVPQTVFALYTVFRVP